MKTALRFLDHVIHLPMSLAFARILSVSSETPNIRRLIVQLLEPASSFPFCPGQWVDFFPVPSNPKLVGGFSICSSPLGSRFVEHRELEFAVQKSNQPVVEWVLVSHLESPWPLVYSVSHFLPAMTCQVHSDACAPGIEVGMAVGGAVYFDWRRHTRADGSLRPALFLCGGVGVTPLISMARFLADQPDKPISSQMIYSARTESDILFRPALDELVSGRFSVQYRLTQVTAICFFI
jgi:ferredoxin-NADP reductase